MPRKALHLPFRSEEAAQVGKNLFRKQILPLGKIEHANGTLDVTPEYVADLAKNFNGGAFDQVAFLLANEANEHHMDPEKYRGELKGVEVGNDGLYGLIELTDEGAKVIEDNPRLGVSARIVQGLENGKDAIQHVLGTLDPRAKGMGQWEAADLSQDDAEVVDLTEAEYSAPVSTTATKTATTDLSAEDAERIVGEMVAKVEKDESGTETVTLSDDARKVIELADRNARSASEEARNARAELAAERFKRERAQYAAAGVPPFMLDLAEPLLTGDKGTIELSNGDSVDAQKVVREMLDKSKGLVDLSAALGAGSGEPGSQEAEAKAEAERWAKQETGQ